MLPERGAVEPEIGGGSQADGIGAGVQDVDAERLTQAVQGAAQAGAGLAPIALGPEHGRQSIAAVPLAADRQVDQQRQRLAQVQLDRPSVALQPWLAEDE